MTKYPQKLTAGSPENSPLHGKGETSIYTKHQFWGFKMLSFLGGCKTFGDDCNREQKISCLPPVGDVFEPRNLFQKVWLALKVAIGFGSLVPFGFGLYLGMLG